MASIKVDPSSDERIGFTARPRTRVQEITEQIVELQNQIRGLERELQRVSQTESVAQIHPQVDPRPNE